jgi:hypothetical protein
MNTRRKERTNFNLPHTPLVKKSVAIRMSMWVRRNSFQVVVFLRSGAGGIRWRFRMFPTV